MIHCPHCGFSLKHPISDGITSCRNCNRIFDTNPLNRVLSAGWFARKSHLRTIDLLLQYGFSFFEADLVYTYVIEQCLPHEEFSKVLLGLGISTKYEICIDEAV